MLKTGLPIWQGPESPNNAAAGTGSSLVIYNGEQVEVVPIPTH